MDLTLGTIVKNSLLAGVLAGLVVATFHFVATEPVLDRAISFEESAHAVAPAPGDAHAEPIVSRSEQKTGLFLGYLIFGVTWSLIAAALFFPAQRWLGRSSLKRVALFAALGYWSIGLLPFLKYPPNPPGVGEPDSINERQAMFFGLLALAVVSSALIIAVIRWKGSAFGVHGERRTIVAGAVLLLGVGALLYFVLPSTPDPVRMPDDIMFDFRLRSFIGTAVFWAFYGAIFGWLLTRRTRVSTLQMAPTD